jgi:hypothetical protein
MRTMRSLAFSGLCFVLAVGALPRVVDALSIDVTKDATYFAQKNPCPRDTNNDGVEDVCWINGYLNTYAANEYFDIWENGWKAWNDGLAEGTKWTLAHGSLLKGTVSVTTFTTFDDCSSTGGVEIRAKYNPGTGDPTNIVWAQALYDNYDVGPDPGHYSGGGAARYEMDVSGSITSPLYPFQYDDKHFYDKPQTFCIEDETIFFHAIALICTVDTKTRTLTAYEGLSYGWDFTCAPAPVPLPPAVWPALSMLAFFACCAQVRARFLARR